VGNAGTHLQVMHPVLTFGLPTLLRRMGSIAVLLLSAPRGEGDLFCGRGTLANGKIGTFAPSGIVVEGTWLWAIRGAHVRQL
jgi:hypothetical protein